MIRREKDDKFHKAIVKADGYADFGILVDGDGVTIREARYVRIIKQYMEDRETHIDNIDKLTSVIAKYQTHLNEFAMKLDAACGERDYYKAKLSRPKNILRRLLRLN